MNFVQISGHWTSWSVFETNSPRHCFCGRLRIGLDVVTVIQVVWSRWVTGDEHDDELDTFTYCADCGNRAKAEATLINSIEQKIAARYEELTKNFRECAFTVESVLDIDSLPRPPSRAQLFLPGIREMED